MLLHTFVHFPASSDSMAATKREFIKLCQAIGLGFVVMGAIGYAIRIIHIPVNQILVS
jgi:uncharacterized membrane protein (Fun14 family)